MMPLNVQTTTQLLQTLIRLFRVKKDTLTFAKRRSAIVDELHSRGVSLEELDKLIDTIKIL